MIMRMGRMAFDLDGNRIARESNVTEREAVRRYNWLVRKDKEISVRAELAELTNKSVHGLQRAPLREQSLRSTSPQESSP